MSMYETVYEAAAPTDACGVDDPGSTAARPAMAAIALAIGRDVIKTSPERRV